MSIIMANVRLPWSDSDVRGPLSSNTFHLDTGATPPDPSQADELAQIFGGFYNTGGLGDYLSSVFSGDCVVSLYNLDDAKPRLPYHVETFTFTPGDDTLPGECAIKVGIQAARQTGVPTQRFRGTLQIGPIVKSTIDDNGRLTDTVMDALETMWTGLADTFNGFNGYTWVVGTEAQGFEPINRVLLSNELGTVRRRQLPYTDRRPLAV